MMFVYEIKDVWSNGRRPQSYFVGSNFRFSEEEFQEIVKETEEMLEKSEKVYNAFWGRGSHIAEYLVRKDNRFFAIYSIKRATVENNVNEEE